MKFLKPYKTCSLSDVTQPFLPTHHAIDWLPKRKTGFGAYGTPLVAPEKVTITKIYDTTDSDITNGYGIWMKGESGYLHEYWHTEPTFPVSLGDTVEQGTIVAYVGNSGNVFADGQYVPVTDRDHPPFSGTHLHHALVPDFGTTKGIAVDQSKRVKNISCGGNFSTFPATLPYLSKEGRYETSLRNLLLGL